MKRINKLLALGAVSSCLLLGAATVSAADKVSVGDSTQKAKKVNAKLLFVIEAKQAVLRHIKGQKFQLKIPLTDIKSVLAFSDRPNRVAFNIKPGNYAKLVHKGQDSFDKNPPNAVLAWAGKGQSAKAYTINSYTKSGGYLTYNLVLLGAKSSNVKEVQRGSVAIFIDMVAISVMAPGYTYSSVTVAGFTCVSSTDSDGAATTCTPSS